MGVSFLSFSQKKLLQKADESYKDKNYLEAINLYQQVYNTKADRSVALKLADSYYSHENYLQAQKYYAVYFKDSVYENIPQFLNYAKSCKITGKIVLAEVAYFKIYQNNQDEAARTDYENYKMYIDTIQKIRSFNVDSNYNCIILDASESLDTEAAPMIYLWRFEDGTTNEGLVLEHCFDKGGENKVILSIRDKMTGFLKQNDTTLSVFIEEPPVKFDSQKKCKQFFNVDFDATPTVFYTSEIIDYIWDMGNGDFRNGKKIKYRYNVCGIYNVKLTVIARGTYNNKKEIFSSYRTVEVLDNYSMPSKTFTDSMNEAK
jgi:hypothetical protein